MHHASDPRQVRGNHHPFGLVRRLSCVLLLTVLTGTDLAGAQLEPLSEPLVIDQVASGAVHLAVDARGRFALVWEKRITSWLAMAVFDENDQSAKGPFRFRDQDHAVADLTAGSIAVDDSARYLTMWEGLRGGGARDLEIVIR